jgi:hypothetical protein
MEPLSAGLLVGEVEAPDATELETQWIKKHSNPNIRI